MARRNNPSRCIQCNACLPDSPTEGILILNTIYVIDPRLCPECAGYYADPRMLQVLPVRPLDDEYRRESGDSLAHGNGYNHRRLSRN